MRFPVISPTRYSAESGSVRYKGRGFFLFFFLKRCAVHCGADETSRTRKVELPTPPSQIEEGRQRAASATGLVHQQLAASESRRKSQATPQRRCSTAMPLPCHPRSKLNKGAASVPRKIPILPGATNTESARP